VDPKLTHGQQRPEVRPGALPIVYSASGLPVGTGNSTVYDVTQGCVSGSFGFGDLAINPFTQMLIGSTAGLCLSHASTACWRCMNADSLSFTPP
jgi:hypothetical protein